MRPLTGSDRKFLRSQAHHLDPLVFVGKHGLTDSLVAAVEDALDSHELIKVKFNDRKDEKKSIIAEMAQRTGSESVGLIGNVAILYREHPDPEKRKIALP